jgi:phosphomannomutase
VASLKKHLGEDNIRRIIDWTLKYLSEIDVPKKRGTFVEFRNGLINISPIGRNCDQEERDEFEAYDKVMSPAGKRPNSTTSCFAGFSCALQILSGTRSQWHVAGVIKYRPDNLQVHGVRKAMVAAFQKEFGSLNLTCSVGGQISFDVFP